MELPEEEEEMLSERGDVAGVFLGFKVIAGRPCILVFLCVFSLSRW